ncbi:hypothetical protein D3C77_366940 [compost metagenome]
MHSSAAVIKFNTSLESPAPVSKMIKSISLVTVSSFVINKLRSEDDKENKSVIPEPPAIKGRDCVPIVIISVMSFSPFKR